MKNFKPKQNENFHQVRKTGEEGIPLQKRPSQACYRWLYLARLLLRTMTKPKLPHEKKKPGPAPRYGKTTVIRVPVVIRKEVEKFIKERMKEKQKLLKRIME